MGKLMAYGIDCGGSASDASKINYDDTNTSLGATNIQSAIESVDTKVTEVSSNLNVRYNTDTDMIQCLFNGAWVDWKSAGLQESVALIPTMTSNTTPSGNVSSNDCVDSFYPYKAFDGNTSTRWASNAGTSAWLSYIFAEKVLVNKVVLRPYYEGGALLKSFKIQASNDGSTWVDLLSATFPNENTAITYKLDNVTPYTHYRIRATSTSYFYSPTAISISYLQFYGRTF